MESNITTFRGRRCTRVKRQGGTAPTASANNSNSTSKTSSKSTSASTSAKPDVASSTTLAGALSPPVPIPPPPPPESETAQGVTSIMRSMLPDTPASNTPKNPAPAPTPAPAPSAPKPNVPAPAPTSTEEETTKPSMSVKPVLESPPANAPPTPIAPPPTSVVPTPAPVASNKPNASPAPPSDPKPKDSPKPGGQAPAAGGQSPPPAGSDPGAAPQPAAASSQRGGGSNPQNTLSAVSGAAPGATNAPNSGSPQPNAGGQPKQPDGSGSGQGSGSDSGTGTGSGSGSVQIQPFPQAGNSPMVNPTVLPFPVMITSNPPRLMPTIIVTTGKGGSLTSFTITPALPKTMVGTSMAGGKMPGGAAGAGATHDPNVPHADGSTHVPGDTHLGQAKKVDVGAIGGAIAAVFGVALIAFLVVFCGKRAKRRKRGSDTPLLRNAGAKPSIKEKVTALMSTARLSSGNTAVTPVAGERRSIKEKVTSFLSVKGLFGGDKAAAPVQRSTTPALERGMREVSTSNVPRSRASSAPAQSFRERALGPLALFGRRSPSQDQIQVLQPETEEAPPRIPTPVAQHRRSASSVSSIIQSWTATGEDNNPFRDPDPARPLRLLNPDLSRSNTANTLNTLRQPLAAAAIPSPLRTNQYPSSPLATTTERSPPPFGPLPSRPQHKRSFSQSRIPNPFVDPEPQSEDTQPASRSQTPDEYMSSRHSRTRSVVSTRQSQYERRLGSLMHQASTSTIDSGFVSATVSPQVRQGGFTRNDKIPSYRVDSDTTPYGLSTVPGSRSDSGSSRRTSSITPSQMLENPDLAESPFSDSHRSSKISFDFGPESLGSEAGPTRPTTSNFPSYILDEGNRRMSRASDPFDLDRPEILGLMKLGLGNGSRDTSLSRSGSGKSVGSERSGMKGKRKSQGTNWFLNSESVREI